MGVGKVENLEEQEIAWVDVKFGGKVVEERYSL